MEHEAISIFDVEQKPQQEAPPLLWSCVFFLVLIYFLLFTCPISIGDYLTAGLLFIFIVLQIRKAFQLKNLTLTQDEILIRYRLTGKTIYITLKEIVYWTETVGPVVDESNLFIYTPTRRIKINSARYFNYTTLKRLLTTGRARNGALELKESRTLTRRDATWALIFALYFARLAYFNHFVVGGPLENKDLYKIRDKIENIEIHEGTKGGISVYLGLLRYPSMLFSVPKKKYRGWFLDTVEEGDSVKIYVLKSNFLSTQKCIKEHSHRSQQWTLWSNTLPILGLNALGNEYISLQRTASDRKIGIVTAAWFFTLLAAFTTLTFLGILMNPEPTPADSDPSKSAGSSME